MINAYFPYLNALRPNENRECGICLGEMDTSEQIIVGHLKNNETLVQRITHLVMNSLHQEHLVHRHCIEPWIKANNSCPVCRVTVANHIPYSGRTFLPYSLIRKVLQVQVAFFKSIAEASLACLPITAASFISTFYVPLLFLKILENRPNLFKAQFACESLKAPPFFLWLLLVKKAHFGNRQTNLLKGVKIGASLGACASLFLVGNFQTFKFSNFYELLLSVNQFSLGFLAAKQEGFGAAITLNILYSITPRIQLVRGTSIFEYFEKDPSYFVHLGMTLLGTMIGGTIGSFMDKIPNLIRE